MSAEGRITFKLDLVVGEVLKYGSIVGGIIEIILNETGGNNELISNISCKRLENKEKV